MSNHSSQSHKSFVAISHTHTPTHACTHARTHARTHTHTHTHTQTCPVSHHYCLSQSSSQLGELLTAAVATYKTTKYKCMYLSMKIYNASNSSQ